MQWIYFQGKRNHRTSVILSQKMILPKPVCPEQSCFENFEAMMEMFIKKYRYKNCSFAQMYQKQYIFLKSVTSTTTVENLFQSCR